MIIRHFSSEHTDKLHHNKAEQVQALYILVENEHRISPGPTPNYLSATSILVAALTLHHFPFALGQRRSSISTGTSRRDRSAAAPVCIEFAIFCFVTTAAFNSENSVVVGGTILFSIFAALWIFVKKKTFNAVWYAHAEVSGTCTMHPSISFIIIMPRRIQRLGHYSKEYKSELIQAEHHLVHTHVK